MKKTMLVFAAGAALSAVVFGFGALLFAESRKTQAAVPPYGAAAQLAMHEELAAIAEPAAAVPARTAFETPAFGAMMSKAPDPNSTLYTVKSGDTLTSIARRYGVTADLIGKINRIPSNRLIPKTQLKIPAQKFSVWIDKSDNRLVLKGGQQVLKTYVVATGKDNGTPVGVFKITDKLVNPTWYHNGKAIPPQNPENILGTRWMGLDLKGYGIHGTTQPETLGRQASAGCVRMKNEDAEELFGYLTPGAEVAVTD